MRHIHWVMLLHHNEAGLQQQTRGSSSRSDALDHSLMTLKLVPGSGPDPLQKLIKIYAQGL